MNVLLAVAADAALLAVGGLFVGLHLFRAILA